MKPAQGMMEGPVGVEEHPMTTKTPKKRPDVADPAGKAGKFKGEIDDDWKAPGDKSKYDHDPHMGQRPYMTHEAREMAEHVTKAHEIMSHPIKKAAVANHYKKTLGDAKQSMKSFGDLQKKIGQDMDS